MSDQDINKTIEQILDVLISNGIVNKESLRNHRIRQRYYELNVVQKVNSEEAFEQISKEFPQLTADGVQYVVYKAKK